MNFNRTERKNPKTTPCFGDLGLAKAAVLASLRSLGSRRCYQHAILEFIGIAPSLAWESRGAWSHDIECILKRAA